MHELSIASSIIEIAEQEAARRRAHVSAVHLKLGPLSAVMKDSLISAYEIASVGTSMESSHLVVEEVSITAYCPNCREIKKIESAQWLCCPVCGTPAGKIVQGTELEITAMEIRHES